MLEGCCSRVVVTAGWNTGMTHSAWRQNTGVKIPASKYRRQNTGYDQRCARLDFSGLVSDATHGGINQRCRSITEFFGCFMYYCDACGICVNCL